MNTQVLSALRPARNWNVRSRLLLATLLSAVLATGMTAGAAASASAASAASYPAMAPSTYEQRVQFWVNKMRKRHDLRRLRVAACPDNVAERWSEHLAVNDLFYHQSMEDVLDRCDAMYAGETLARGAITPRHLVRLWMNSSGHRHVLLSSESRRIGIGATPDAHGRWVVAANFVRV